MVTQHIHNSDFRNCNSEKVGTLVDYCAHKKSAVRAAVDSNEFRRCISLLDQVLCCCYEVVEHILLLHLCSGLVPFLAELAASSQVGNHIDTSALYERNPHCAESRCQAYVESAVSVQEYRVLPVLLYSFTVSHEHVYHCAVLAGVCELFGNILFRNEIYLRGKYKFRLVAVEVVLVYGSGEGV